MQSAAAFQMRRPACGIPLLAPLYPCSIVHLAEAPHPRTGTLGRALQTLLVLTRPQELAVPTFLKEALCSRKGQRHLLASPMSALNTHPTDP